ncbi:MAG: sensor domain-containing diguanylate cyclase [Armatimonadota bacterium]
MTKIDVEPGAAALTDLHHLLQVANEIGVLITNARDERPLFTEIINRLPGAFSLEHAAILLNDGNTPTVATDSKLCPLSVLADIAQQCLQSDTEEVMLLTDISQHPQAPHDDAGTTLLHSLQTLILIPLTSQGVMLGAIMLGSEQPRTLAPAERDVLALIGKLLAGGLRQLRLQISLNAASSTLAAQKEQLYQNTITDPMTELPNRQYFLDYSPRLVNEAQQTGSTLSLLVIDVDHFKAINDRYGHQFGDNVLVRIAKAIQDSIRGRDMAARYDGEEFCILLPATDGTGAVVVAERLREYISNLALSGEEVRWYLTVSIGVASLSPRITTAEQLIAKADESLREAKQLGGNQIIFDWDEAFEAFADN